MGGYPKNLEHVCLTSPFDIYQEWQCLLELDARVAQVFNLDIFVLLRRFTEHDLTT